MAGMNRNEYYPFVRIIPVRCLGSVNSIWIKVTCCGGALAFSEPEKAQAQIKDIIEAAYDSGAEMLVTPCPLCQANTEVYQGQINKKYGTKFNMPVLYYSQLMVLAYGGSAKDAGLNGQVIKARKLEEFAGK
jgi:heterodisulfide reductase subunit B